MSKENRVKIKLRRATEGQEKEVFVGLNGEFFRIQRGVEVEVPEGVKEILERSEMAEDDLQVFIEENTGTGSPAK